MVPVSCTLPAGTAAAPFFQQLQLAPQRTFAPVTFGPSHVVLADVVSAGSIDVALAAAVDVMVAAAGPASSAEASPAARNLPLSPVELQTSMTFSVTLPRTGRAGDSDMRGVQQQLFVAALQEALPPGSTARTERSTTLPSAVLITATADVPAEASEAASQLQAQLEQEPQTVFRHAVFTGVRLVALQHKVAEAVEAGRQVLAFSVTLPDIKSGEVLPGDKEEALLAAIQGAMPGQSMPITRLLGLLVPPAPLAPRVITYKQPSPSLPPWSC